MTREEIVNGFSYNASKKAVEYSQPFASKEELQEDIVDAYVNGAEFGYKFALVKAIEWIEKIWPYKREWGARSDQVREAIQQFKEDFEL